MRAAPGAFALDADHLAGAGPGAAALSEDELLAVARGCPALAIHVFDERGEERELSKLQAEALVSSLFTGPDPGADPAAEVRKWACALAPEEREEAALTTAGPRPELRRHAREWIALMDALGADDPDPCDPGLLASAN